MRRHGNAQCVFSAQDSMRRLGSYQDLTTLVEFRRIKQLKSANKQRVIGGVSPK